MWQTIIEKYNMDINLVAPINYLGYGNVGKNIAYELQKLHNVSLFPISNVQILKNDKCVPNIQTSINNSATPNFTSPCIRIWHAHDMSHMVGSGEHVAFPIFELDKFTDREKHHLVNQDLILVCSEWAKEVVCKELASYKTSQHVAYDIDFYQDHAVKVVPLGVDTDVFDCNMVTESHKTTRFFNCGKTEVRKGHDILHEVFNKAFTPDDDVELNIMWDNPFLKDEEKAEWEQMYLLTPMGKAGKIKFLPRVDTSHDVARVMLQMDCGVFLSRAEGWNLEALEMMAMGKDIIITDYSAHTEFCNSDNSMLVEIDDTETAYDGKWFFGAGSWAKLGDRQIEAAVSHMQGFHYIKQGGEDTFNTGGIETAKQFSWENSAKKLIECLS